VVRWSFLALALLPLAPRAHAAGVTLHDTTVVLDGTLIRGTEGTAYVSVRGSTDLDASQPVKGAEILLVLERGGEPGDPKELKKESRDLARVATDGGGEAVVRFRVPEVDPGSWRLVARSRSPHGEDTVTRAVTVMTRLVVHLRTDRPVYKPGQSIRWRVTAVSSADAHPKARAPIELVIEDPRGTKMWRGRVETDETGMASGALPLGEDLILGEYRLTATADAVTTSETVEVKEFVLPPFNVEIRPRSRIPAAHGERFEGEIVATYTYGEPVAGRVTWTCVDDDRQTEDADLDAGGRAAFRCRPDGDGTSFQIVARVTDGAGRSRSAELDVPIRGDDLEMAIITEGRNANAGDAMGVTIVTTDGKGNFVPARVLMKKAGASPRQEARSDGVVRFEVKPGSSYHVNVQAVAVTDDGRTATAQTSFYRDSQAGLVHVKDAVIDEGSTIQIDARWPHARGPVIATLLRYDTPLATSVAKVDAKGDVSAVIAPPEGVFGLATVRLVDAGFDPMTGAPPGTAGQATVFLRPAKLDVTIVSDTRHAPGKTAKLSVKVRDAKGRPVEDAGLAASVVDERVLALGARRPDLGRVLGSLDTSKAQAAGIAFAELLAKSDAMSRLALRAIVESLPPAHVSPLIRSDAADRVRDELVRLDEAEPAAYGVLLVDARPIGKKVGKGWEFASELDEVLERAKWTRERRETPWKVPTTWAYARKLVPHWTFDPVARSIAEERLDRLQKRLRALGAAARTTLHKKKTAGLAALVRSKRVDAYLAIDPWGNAIEVTRETDGNDAWIEIVSAGPDGIVGSVDDFSRVDVFGESRWGFGTIGHGAGGGGSGYGVGSGRGGMMGRASSAPRVMVGAEETALRQRFDETVLWVTGVRTGPGGKVDLEVPLADSITGWEVRVEAVSARGAVGTGTSRFETFLPLHADAELPGFLTRGDRYAVPVVIANHSGRDRRLGIAAAAAGGLSLPAVAGSGSDRLLMVPSGTTRLVKVWVDATAPGTGALTISLTEDGRVIDAMKRSVRIDPPGPIVREIESGRVDRKGTTIEVEVPKTAIAAATTARLRVFRGVSDQAIDGLEDLLQAPSGCFEQTSSTTHPNLLVLELLQGRKGADEARARALEYVARGYQRLISYEVQGGGFSWFGDAPANQVLTAYGLLEFVDMKRVYPVDPDVIERTRRWLLSKQQADGSWKPDEAWLHDWSAVQGKVSTTAYVAWTLAESGYRGKALDRALGYLRKNQGTLAKDPYLLALWAGAESAAGRPGNAMALLAKHGVREDGKLRVRAGGRTLFYSTGTGADVQVTALATTAMKRAGRGADAAAALSWVWDARSAGGWDSTQGVVLSLRAAAALAEREAPPSGVVDVKLDGRVVGRLDLGGEGIPTVEIGGVPAGKHVVSIDGVKSESLLYDLRVSWREDGVPSAVEKGLAVDLVPHEHGTSVGGLLPLSVRVRNPGKETVPMPTIVVPVPPGFRASAAKLKTLVREGRVEKADDLGSEVHLYLTELRPGRDVSLSLEWEAVADCVVMQRPAVAYAYYDPSTRGASGPAKLEVAPGLAGRTKAAPTPPPPTAMRRPPRE
jgi:hypothetical protein